MKQSNKLHGSERTRWYTRTDEKRLLERVGYIGSLLQIARAVLSKTWDKDSPSFYRQEALVNSYRRELGFLRRELVSTLRLKYRGKPAGIPGALEDAVASVGEVRVEVSA